MSRRPSFKLGVAAAGGILPFDIAFSADIGFLLAWVVARGENDGAMFDWARMRWITKA